MLPHPVPTRRHRAARAPLGLRRRMRGAIAVAYLLMSIVLLGFVGMGLDIGRLYVAKTETQNAADACALAASAALTGASTNQLITAEDWGITAGTRNRIGMQDTPVAIPVDSAVTFSDTLDGVYQPKSAIAGDANILSKHFVRCTLNDPGVDSYLMKVVTLLTGGTAFTTQTIPSTAVASLQPSISHCAIPIAACSQGGGAPHYGMTPGRWYRGKLNAGNAQMSSGAFRWVDFPGATEGVPALRDLLAGAGQCNLNAATQVGSQNGQVASLNGAYNGRFGLYQGGNPNNLEGTPDFTGYPYFPPVAVAEGINEYTPATSAFDDFQLRRAAFTPYQNITNFIKPNAWNTIPGTGATPPTHQTGSDRRLVVMPVASCSPGIGPEVLTWACFLMLHPIFNPNDDMWLEYRGNAASISSGCVTSGLPGGPGAGGPKVPGLSQ